METYSQKGQDLFVMDFIHKTDGTYLDLGCSGPKNNTYLLEKTRRFQGLSIDSYEDAVAQWENSDRDIENIHLRDYKTLDIEDEMFDFYVNGNIDYMSFEVDTAHSIDLLRQLPFDDYKFGIVTYQHDIVGAEASRAIFTEYGYKKVTTECMNDYDVTSSAYQTQDWWFHPDIVNIPDQYVEKDITQYLLH